MINNNPLSSVCKDSPILGKQLKSFKKPPLQFNFKTNNKDLNRALFAPYYVTQLIPVLLFVLLGWQQGQAQFTTQGSATPIGVATNPPPAPPSNCGDAFELTPDINSRIGAVWANNRVDLTKGFTLNASLFFGGNDAGADGIAFALQNDNRGLGTLGGVGGGLGLVGINPSIAVEFDDFDNTLQNVPDEGVADHMDIIEDGAIGVPGPFPGNIPLPNVEDGQWHNIVITWDPCGIANEQCLTVVFDGTTTIIYCDDIINNVFNGVTDVFWGFTASTGGARNQQVVCIGEMIHPSLTIDPIQPICLGESISIESIGVNTVSGTYNWFPTPDNISLTSTGEIATYNNVQASFLVTVEVIDDFGCILKEEVQVEANPLPTIDVNTTSAFLCNNDQATVTVTSPTGTTQLCYVDNGGVLIPIPNPFVLTHTTLNPILIPTSIDNNGRSIYTFIGKVVDTLGCESTAPIIVEGSNLTVQMATTTPNDVCQGTIIGYLTTASGGSNPYDFVWSENGNILSSFPNPGIPTTNPGEETNAFNFSPTTLGQGWVEVEITDEFGCAVTGEIPYILRENPTVVLNVSEDTVCRGDEVTLSVLPDNAASYDWTPSTLGTTPIVTTTADQLGNNPFSVLVTTVHGCEGTAQVAVQATSCCQVAANSTDYIRLDPDNPDSRIATYGIVRVGTSRIYRLSGNSYNRFPERMYFADGVILQVFNVTAPTATIIRNTVDVTNSDLVFGQGAGIVLRRTKLIANNTVFRPCNEAETWTGIRIQGVANPMGFQGEANFRECTFVNATFGAFYHRAGIGELTDNLFYNCQHAITSIQGISGTITNNTIRVDDKIESLVYTPISEIDGYGLNNNVFSIPRHRNNYTGILASSTYNTSSIAVLSTGNIISQNKFINGISLGRISNRNFYGIALFHMRGSAINISNNSFTNNDIAVETSFSRAVSIENNHMEVTRRSRNDESFYQVVTMGVFNGQSSLSSTLIKGNTIVNSSDVQNLTIASTSVGAASFLQRGTGGIYVSGNNNCLVKDNDISDFEIGIYQDGGLSNSFTNNRIRAHVYGIYQEGGRPFIGCNEIEMDLDANVVADAGVVGIYVASGSVKQILGNCIRNTDRAIVLDKSANRYSFIPAVSNNYLYNYTEAGLYIRGFSNSVLRSNMIRRNAFISNQQNGDPLLGIGSGAFDIVTEATTAAGLTSNSGLAIGGNYFGAKGMMNGLAFSTSMNNFVFTLGTPLATDLKSFTACGNMDVTGQSFEPFDLDWLHRCDDDGFNIGSLVAQRTNTGNQLIGGYQDALTDLSETDLEQAEGLILTNLQSLTDLAEVEALYIFAQQLNLTPKALQWMNVYYHQRKGDYTTAQQILTTIQADGKSEAEKMLIQKAYLDMSIRNATTLTNTDLIDALKEMAEEYGSYKHEARELLRINAGLSYDFEFNPVKLYKKSAQTFATGTATTTNSNIRISPNPATDKITINIITDQSIEWTTAELYDIHGRLLFSQPIRSYSLSFDLETLAKGVYVITLKTADGDQSSEKFVKQ